MEHAGPLGTSFWPLIVSFLHHILLKGLEAAAKDGEEDVQENAVKLEQQGRLNTNRLTHKPKN